MRASRSGLPISRVMSCAIASARSSISPAAAFMTAARLAAEPPAHSARASSAAWTARSTSSRVELGNSPTSSSGRAGLRFSYVSPAALGRHWPAMKFAGAVMVSAMAGSYDHARPGETVYVRSAMVSSADHVATGAGVAMLRAGGSAADAAIAANAVLAVTWPQHCGPGGDLFALVHVAGGDEPAALNASGRAGSGADAERLRAEGEIAMPAHGDIRAVTVPGCVDGWIALHERFGRLELADVLEPARGLAAEGFAASPTLVAAAEALPVGDAAASSADEVAALRRLTRPGAALRRPGLARALAAITRDGRSGFYEGPFGEGLVAAGDGEFSRTDLERPGADWV